MGLENAKKVILKWAQRETGLVFIYTKQGKPRPQMPYGAITIPGNGTRIGGIDEIRYDRDEEKFMQEGGRTTLLIFDILGTGANELMSRLRDTVDRPDVIEEFQRANIAIQTDQPPQDLSELEDTKTPERSQMTAMLGFTISYETTVQPIETVELTADNTVMGNQTTIITIEED